VIRETLERWYAKSVGVARIRLERSLGRVYSRTGLVQLLYVVAVVALMAGFIDAVFFPVPNQAQIVQPGPGAQTIPEAVLDAFIILVGAAGIYVAYISGRQTTRSRMVNLYLGIALMLVALSIFMGTYLSILKG
jgi:heme/copper-type cytochrome/quinol oxidase subunit 3